ncbi:MAG: hypothetical protein ACLGSA_11920 [Acidobacteriota bacterium]
MAAGGFFSGHGLRHSRGKSGTSTLRLPGYAHPASILRLPGYASLRLPGYAHPASILRLPGYASLRLP